MTRFSNIISRVGGSACCVGDNDDDDGNVSGLFLFKSMKL